MASSYATFLVLVCGVAILALTAPSAANVRYRVNLNGALVCAGTGKPAAPNVTASLACVSQSVGVGVVLEAITTATGTVSANVTVGIRTRTAISPTTCGLLLPPQACSGTANVTIATTVAVTKPDNRNMITITPSSQVDSVVTLPVST